MNLVETYVTNITNIGEPNEYNFVKVTADFNCYGHKEIQTTKELSEIDMKMVKERGYYLS